MPKLRNLKRQMRVFNLEHSSFVNKAGEHPIGKPESLTLLPLEVREVSVETLLCVEVAKALKTTPKKRATLRVVG